VLQIAKLSEGSTEGNEISLHGKEGKDWCNERRQSIHGRGKTEVKMVQVGFSSSNHMI